MGTTVEVTAIFTVLTLLIGVSALGGALWSQARFLPRVRALRLAEQLAALSRTLELLVARLETAKPASIEPERPRASTVNVRLDPGEQSAVTGPTLIAVPDLARPSESASLEVADELARRFSKVWTLADSGQTLEAIARETGQPIGHVELILGLRRQIDQGRTPPKSSGGGRPA